MGLGGGGSPGGGAEPPHLALLGSEAWTWEGVANLDQFITRIYRQSWMEGLGLKCPDAVAYMLLGSRPVASLTPGALAALTNCGRCGPPPRAGTGRARALR